MVSIIIPVYNTAKYLHKCLSSIINQSYKDFEVICVDDGSTDNSLAVLQDYQKIDDRIIIVSRENGGVSKARNIGIEHASGEYITFIDSDDWVHHQYLEALIQGMNASNVNMSIVSYKEISNYEEEIVENAINALDHLTIYNIDQIMNKYKYKSRCWGKIYKTNIIRNERVLFPETIKIGEDGDFVYNYLSRIVNQPMVAVIESDLYYYYHEREDSAIHSINETDTIILVDYFIRSMDSVNAWLRRNYAMEGLKKMLRIRYTAKLTHKKEVIGKSNNSIRMIFKKISAEELTIPTYLLYRLFYLLPWTYHLFMIINDPTLIQFEKSVKLNNK